MTFPIRVGPESNGPIPRWSKLVFSEVCLLCEKRKLATWTLQHRHAKVGAASLVVEDGLVCEDWHLNLGLTIWTVESEVATHR